MHALGNSSSTPPLRCKHRILGILEPSSSSSTTMGRRKLPISRIDDEPKLQITYSKRKHGIIKKAYEMSVLSDVEVAFISFSPAKRLSFFSGDNRIEDIFERYMNMSDSRQKYTPAEQEHILEILNVIRHQNVSSSCQHSEAKALQQQITRKQEEIMTITSSIKKFEVEDGESIMSLADIESHEKFLVDALQQFSHRKSCLFQTHNRLDWPLDQNYISQAPAWLDGPSEGQDHLFQEKGWMERQLMHQADADTVLPTPVSADWNWMPEGALNVNAPRSSLNLVYQGLGQDPDPHLHAKNASSPDLAPLQASFLSTAPNNSTLSNPNEGMPGMEMPLRAAAEDDGLEQFNNLAEYSSFSAELDF